MAEGAKEVGATRKSRAVERARILPFDKGERDGFRKEIIMRPPFPRFFFRPRLGLTCAVLLTAGLLGACDRHSAQDVPESYGHGSSHQHNYDNHQIDSLKESKSFSDTQGLPAEGGNAGPGEAPKAEPVNSSPNPKPSAKRFGFGGY